MLELSFIWIFPVYSGMFLKYSASKHLGHIIFNKPLYIGRYLLQKYRNIINNAHD